MAVKSLVPSSDIQGNLQCAVVTWTDATLPQNSRQTLLWCKPGWYITNIEAVIVDEPSSASSDLDLGYRRHGAGNDVDYFVNDADFDLTPTTETDRFLDSRARSQHRPFLFNHPGTISFWLRGAAIAGGVEVVFFIYYLELNVLHAVR